MKLLVAATILAALSSPAALAQSGAGAGNDEPTPAAAPACPNCGVVTAIRAAPLRGEPKWLGTISGGIPSSPSTSAVGAGRGLPSGGGVALPGQDTDLGGRRRTVYEVVVTMDDRSTRKLHYEHRPALSVGDRVRVSGGQVYLR